MANSDILGGNELYQKRARVALPYLIRQAKASQKIYYSDLAKEVGMSNPRNLNYVLGAIGDALLELGKREKRKIPPIQSLVVNKNQGLPSEGLSEFIDDYDKLNKAQKEKIVNGLLIEIYCFPHWDWVLKQLDLEAVKTDLKDIIKKARNWKGGGEGEQHKKFKEFISKNPKVLGLSRYLKDGEQEHSFPSADTVDVLFLDKGLKIGVEVKSSISNTEDILRGLFQCVKYKCLIEAEQIINDEIPNSMVILALQGKFPDELIVEKNLLGVKVIDSICDIKSQ